MISWYENIESDLPKQTYKSVVWVYCGPGENGEDDYYRDDEPKDRELEQIYDDLSDERHNFIYMIEAAESCITAENIKLRRLEEEFHPVAFEIDTFKQWV
jgi:hypothetical protein